MTPTVALSLEDPHTPVGVHSHICLPLRFLGASGYTNEDFVDAYFSVMQSHWDAGLEAQRRGDQAGSSKAVGPVLHSVIDLYWPNRVERDLSGAITRFRDCEDLGNLQGVLREEKTGPGLTAEAEERTKYYLGQVIRKQMDARPFEEVAEILRTGPMKLSEAHAAVPLGQK